jgi:ribonuclease I
MLQMSWKCMIVLLLAAGFVAIAPFAGSLDPVRTMTEAVSAGQANAAETSTSSPALVPSRSPADAEPSNQVPAAAAPAHNSGTGTGTGTSSGTGTGARASRGTDPGRGKTAFVLGLAWQPAFCATRRTRPECISQSADRADARQFSLLGLWRPRETFCNVAEVLREDDRKRDWMKLPAVPLKPDLAARLAVAMPGTASGLDRHQWLRGGSCQALDPDAYFSLQMRLLDAVNASDVGTLFRERIGREVTATEVKAAFDHAFFEGAGSRIKMQCRQVGDRMLVTGLTVGLGAEISATSDLGGLVRAASPTTFRCEKGFVSAANAGRNTSERGAMTP